MDGDSDGRPVREGWVEAMERSDSDIAAGRTVPAAEVHRHLRESIARTERRIAEQERRRADRS